MRDEHRVVCFAMTNRLALSCGSAASLVLRAAAPALSATTWLCKPGPETTKDTTMRESATLPDASLPLCERADLGRTRRQFAASH